MKTRDAIANLGMELCREADRWIRSAESAALKAITDDPSCRDAAIKGKATADGLMYAVKKVDDLRIKLEQGEVS